ncbi:very short patch repair endonuclease [Asticcacaulis sp.]|uniref:very short patch repair endonuclease n=1 Tax=Asticcacaulis sp. TaxID=1872648 RepID=UPI00262F779A|nr:very short patch repair endonuclease [Asticcacaulis sp.]
MVDRVSGERRSWNMSRIRSRDTGPEIHLRSLLHRAGFRFRLHAKDLDGKPDIVLPKYRTAIFVHGCFWHRHTNCRNATIPSTRAEFWQKKFDDNVARDRRNSAALEAKGWTVITVWDCDLKADPDRMLQNLSAKMREVA